MSAAKVMLDDPGIVPDDDVEKEWADVTNEVEQNFGEARGQALRAHEAFDHAMEHLAYEYGCAALPDDPSAKRCCAPCAKWNSRRPRHWKTQVNSRMSRMGKQLAFRMSTNPRTRSV